MAVLAVGVVVGGGELVVLKHENLENEIGAA